MASTRVVLNRQALDQVTLAMADGLTDLAQAVVESANPPDAPPIGKGLVQHGAWGTWVKGKKVAGTASKPRSVGRLPKDAILTLGGFGFPARFQELGTIKQPARPFLTPALMAKVPQAEGFIRAATARRLRGLA